MTSSADVRVLYIIDSLVPSGGAEQALAAMAPHYRALGIDLTVATLTDRPGLHHELRTSGARVCAPVLGSRPRQLQQLTALVRSVRPDLVHTTLFEADVLGRAAAARAGTPAVTSLVNAPYGPEHRADPSLRRARLLGAQAVDVLTAQTARRFHALTEHVADAMAHRLLLRRGRIEVIPRGRDPLVLGTRSPQRTTRVRRDLGVPPEVPVVLGVARQEHQKGLDVLVEASALLIRSRPDAWLLLAGREGNASPAVRAAVAQHPRPGQVRLLGIRTDVPDLMAAADVLAVPSRWEGLGSTALEGMGVGVPVVASDVPALRETLGSPGCGWLVPPGNPRRLCGAIEEALGPTARDRSSRAQARFTDRYTLSRVVQEMAGFYTRALA